MPRSDTFPLHETLVTRAVIFLTSASKFNIEPNGGISDASLKNDHASTNVKTAFAEQARPVPLTPGSSLTLPHR